MHTEVAQMPRWVSIFLTLWAPAGPLVGIFIGHYLTRSYQRRQWLTDNRLQEWRELITTVMSSFTTILTLGTATVIEGEQIRRVEAQGVAAIEVIGNRIFIHDDVERIQLLDRWNNVTHSFFAERNAKEFSSKFQEIMATIVKAAKADIASI